MPTIRILPLDATIEAPADATLMAAAQRLGYYWPTTCGGEARCTTCACEIVDGAEQLSDMGRAERTALVEERGQGVLATPVRLACQARVCADATVVVRKAGVRAPLDASA